MILKSSLKTFLNRLFFWCQSLHDGTAMPLEQKWRYRIRVTRISHHTTQECRYTSEILSGCRSMMTGGVSGHDRCPRLITILRTRLCPKTKKPDDPPCANVQVRPRTRFRDARETSSKASGYNAPAGISCSESKEIVWNLVGLHILLMKYDWKWAGIERPKVRKSVPIGNLHRPSSKVKPETRIITSFCSFLSVFFGPDIKLFAATGNKEDFNRKRGSGAEKA